MVQNSRNNYVSPMGRSIGQWGKQHIESVVRLTVDFVWGRFPQKKTGKSLRQLVVGHRGVFAHPSIAENTLAAFDLAVSCGAGIELDLRITRDGVPVVCHDADAERVFFSPLRISEVDFSRLRNEVPGIPTLDEVFLSLGKSCPFFMLEDKTRGEESRKIAEKVKELVEKYCLLEKCLLCSLENTNLDTWRECFPDVLLARIFEILPESAAAYVAAHSDTGLLGWYLTFPSVLRDKLLQEGRPCGVGFADSRHSLRRCLDQGYSFVFCNRVDKTLDS